MIRRVTGFYLISLGLVLSYAMLIAIGRITPLIVEKHQKYLLPFSEFFLAWLAFVCLMPLVRWPFYFGRKLTQRRAEVIRATDPRAPVLLLRSFADDGIEVQSTSEIARVILARYFVWHYLTLEELLVRIFSSCGPVIAIGRPGEEVPPLGAAREWVSNYEWKRHVNDLLGRCKLAVVILGNVEQKDGLAWEIQSIIKLGMLEKTLLVLPPLP